MIPARMLMPQLLKVATKSHGLITDSNHSMYIRRILHTTTGKNILDLQIRQWILRRNKIDCSEVRGNIFYFLTKVGFFISWKAKCQSIFKVDDIWVTLLTGPKQNESKHIGRNRTSSRLVLDVLTGLVDVRVALPVTYLF